MQRNKLTNESTYSGLKCIRVSAKQIILIKNTFRLVLVNLNIEKDIYRDKHASRGVAGKELADAVLCLYVGIGTYGVCWFACEDR